jgi:Fe-S cluster assembly protein SufD
MEALHAQQYYSSDHRLFESNGASRSPEWMKPIRAMAMASFTEQGFPGTDREEWRFTNIAPIAKQEFAHSSKKEYPALTRASIEPYVIERHEHRFVFVNGHYAKQLSSTAALPQGLTIFNLESPAAHESDELRRHLAQHANVRTNAFTALNTAFVSDGLFLQLRPGVAVDAPIHILNIAIHTADEPASAAYPRLMIAAEDGSSATVIESFVAADARVSFTNAVTEIVLAPKSSLDYVKIQNENTGSYHMHTISVKQEQESRLNMFSLAVGAAISRSEIGVDLDGERADCNVNGLYMGDGAQLTDHHTFIHHKAPECTSHELFKGILDGSSRAVYTGKVYVDAIAQKTDSKQTNRNLMLSESATVDTQPQLEIFADDVKCTHGAAVGGMNEQTVFYLKSRGIGGITARGIVTVGFAAEVTEKIEHESSRTMVDALVVTQLRKTLGNEIPEIVHSGKKDEKE